MTGDGLSRRDLEWIASAIKYPEEFLALGMPPDGAVSPRARKALQALRDHYLRCLAAAAEGRN